MFKITQTHYTLLQKYGETEIPAREQMEPSGRGYALAAGQPIVGVTWLEVDYGFGRRNFRLTLAGDSR